MGAMASTPTTDVSSGVARAQVAGVIEGGLAAGFADGPAVSNPIAHLPAEPARHVSRSGMRSDVTSAANAEVSSDIARGQGTSLIGRGTAHPRVFGRVEQDRAFPAARSLAVATW